MGTWSHEPFGNDTAADWAYELAEKPEMAAIEAAFDQVLAAGEEGPEADVCEEAVAAAEVLAKLLGQGTQTDAYTERADAWVAATALKPSAELRSKAHAALGQVLGDNSELAELWQEGEDGEAWQASVRQLQQVIKG
ncbi:MAG: DUF4259 domain-containing protein [Candidatus Sericytochromatia bacterium]